jgi:hypothetical protein
MKKLMVLILVIGMIGCDEKKKVEQSSEPECKIEIYTKATMVYQSGMYGWVGSKSAVFREDGAVKGFMVVSKVNGVISDISYSTPENLQFAIDKMKYELMPSDSVVYKSKCE